MTREREIPQAQPVFGNGDMTMKRQIAIGDIHGRFDLLRELVERKILFDAANDTLVFLGDYIDRGPESRQVVEYADRLKKTYPDRIVLLKGNHEELAVNALTRGDPADAALWFLNGGGATLASYGGMDACRTLLLPFISTLELYRETDTHIFVHAGVERNRQLRDTSPEVLLWSRAMEAHDSGKTVVVGHTRHETVTSYDGVVAVDTGAVVSGVLSAYDVFGKKIFTTDAR